LIRRVEVVNGAIPLTGTEPRQLWVAEWSSQLYVKVETDDMVGWGEILPAGGSSREPYAVLVKRLGEFLSGEDESDPQRLWETMRRLTFSGGYGITTGAISGIDLALWDVKARGKGDTLAGLLGGSPCRIERYASLSRYGSAGEAVKAVGWLLEKGYSSIKLHQTSRDTEEAARLARKEHGKGFELMADLNCAFAPSAAREFMRRVEPFDLAWVEEPVWPPDDFESLRELNKLGPVAAGENAFSALEFRRLMEMEALSYYQPDVAKVGGVTPTLEILAMAKAHGAKIAFHNRPDNGWVGTMASAHLAAALRKDAIVESPPNELPTKYFAFSGKMDPTHLEPGGPGIGVVPKDDIPVSTESKMLRFH
jgi:L-alanine-DL-glutamate epimerase-like enolase superfamily enzyme